MQRITKLSLVNAGSGYGNNTGSDEIFYNATLGPSTTGDFATARVKIDTSHELTSDIKIMNGGSGFIVGDVLTVTGIDTTTSGGGFTAGTVRVDAIMDNVGDTIRVSGITSDTAKDIIHSIELLVSQQHHLENSRLNQHQVYHRLAL